MSLSIHEIERSVGVDLLRRPLVTSVINSAILSFYLDTFFIDPDLLPSNDDPAESRSLLQAQWVGVLSGVLVAVLTHLVVLFGVLETAVWTTFAVLFKLFRLPRVYVFEKLVLDLRVLFLGPSVKYVDKKVRLYGVEDWEMPRVTVSWQGLFGVGVTTVKVDDGLGREIVALLHLLRYVKGWGVGYFGEDTIVLVGKRKRLVDGLLGVSQGGKVFEGWELDLGWHRDVVEKTNFKMRVSFEKGGALGGESEVRFIGRRRVEVEIEDKVGMESLELLAHLMGQFAAVCEAGGVGRRLFNGKRFSIYMLGLAISLSLIVFYEGAEGLLRPSADVLTLAVGAYTLWMTIGKSAALGETSEDVELNVVERKNILMAFHGLAKVKSGMVNHCWVPEVHRPVEILRGSKESESARGEEAKGLLGGSGGLGERSMSGVLSNYSEGTEILIQDASISKFEAALCLSIVDHFGHYLKWKSEKLVLDHFILSGGRHAHVVAVERVDAVQQLDATGMEVRVERIGGNGRGKRRRRRHSPRTWRRGLESV